MAKMHQVVLGVTGSIAAYKAAELVRRMKDRGWDVSVILTRCALQFVGEQTFLTLSRNPVATEMFETREQWRPDHISYAERADVLVIAPCTANMLAKLAHGFADDLLSCTALATKAPVVVAPAMNENMWEHPATRANVALLQSRGVTFVDVGKGELACGVVGSGRLAELEAILEAVAGKLAAARRAGRR
jgi:phosphopantothenoylcysteine decarboxylase/phosphopantothenoylcysteine decarboxylase/phosphopantothenate--cysteine ligase